MTEILIRYVHILAVLVLFACLVSQHMLVSAQVPRATLRRIAILDGLYGLSAMIVLAAGLVLWFGVGKPAAYYNGFGLFHLKVTLFVVIGLLSIYPTVFFRRAMKAAAETVTVPKGVIMVIRLELLLVALMPLLAICVARGVGGGG
ncbi:DUF2214 family protein [Marinihelvus fidelis]|uniref:DUF2214 family protein n=1 Tax=Marinihelvus fidelis TaxID=2613842 RepID=A0A5N0TE89_9GAMM|nr:DUF2214 family protein [Marinihelvus fidelis]KAA9132774.1 DUF2214 family protein [Marinihelvus fidelis]